MNAAIRLMIVDDDVHAGTLVGRALKECRPATIEHITDGERALDSLLGPHGPAPDLVLLDLKMPSMSGFEVLVRMRDDARTRHLPVIVFSTSSEPEDIARAYECGANAFVEKPLSLAALRSALRSIVEFWGRHNLAARRTT